MVDHNLAYVRRIYYGICNYSFEIIYTCTHTCTSIFWIHSSHYHLCHSQSIVCFPIEGDGNAPIDRVQYTHCRNSQYGILDMDVYEPPTIHIPCLSMGHISTFELFLFTWICTTGWASMWITKMARLCSSSATWPQATVPFEPKQKCDLVSNNGEFASQKGDFQTWWFHHRTWCFDQKKCGV